MKTTGVFTINEYTIKVKSVNDEVLLIPFGDIHYGAPNHAGELFDEFLSWAKRQKNAYFIGMGDYLDVYSTSERERLSMGLHETTIEDLQNAVLARTREFTKKLEFMRGRIIGFVEGNHYATLRDGRTTTQYMAHQLGAKYLGVESFSRVTLDNNSKRIALDIYAHHGLGGSARLLGGSLNRLQYAAEWAIADIYLMGHDHKRVTGKVPRLHLQHTKAGLEIKEREMAFVRTASFQKGRMDGKASHVADKGMGPSSLGWTYVTVYLKRKTVDGAETFSHKLMVTI